MATLNDLLLPDAVVRRLQQLTAESKLWTTTLELFYWEWFLVAGLLLFWIYLNVNRCLLRCALESVAIISLAAGMWSLLVPPMGPIYEAPEKLQWLDGTMIHLIYTDSLSMTADSVAAVEHGQDLMIHSLDGLTAFPVLRIATLMAFVVVAWHVSRWAFIIMCAVTLMVSIATVMFSVIYIAELIAVMILAAAVTHGVIRLNRGFPDKKGANSQSLAGSHAK